MENVENRVVTTLVGGILAGATTCQVASGVSMPAVSFRMVIDEEVFLVTNKGAGLNVNWSIQGGQEGTTPADHLSGAKVVHMLTAQALKNLITQIASGGGTPSVVTAVTSPSAAEGASLQFGVTLNTPTPAIQVLPFTIAGTATAGADYNATPTFTNGVTRSGTDLLIPSGVSAFVVTFATIDDAAVESNETIILTVGGVSGTGLINDNDGVVIGGQVVGVAGTGIYAGFTLRAGDDFATLDILAPARPRGKWFTTRTYLYGARTSDGGLSNQFDTDPLFTGTNDANRGVPFGYDNMAVESSVLKLTARKATTPEKVPMIYSRNQVAAMYSGAGAFSWYPGAAGTDDIILEARIKLSNKTTNPAGWHPTFWLQSLTPTIALDSDELDWEGNSQGMYLNQNLWTAGSATANPSGSTRFDHDGAFHTITYFINTTNVRIFIDGSLYATGNWNGNTKNKPQYPLFTSHIYNPIYNGETFSQVSWDAAPSGATMEVDWVRVWNRSAKPAYAPLVNVNDVNVAYGSAFSVVLPSAATLWGDASVTEYVQVVYNEENGPDMAHASGFVQFPAGVTFNAGTRTLAGTIGGNSKTGRLDVVVSCWKSGSVQTHLRFAINVGPRLSVSSLNVVTGVPLDLNFDALCDCGVLTSNGTIRTKTVTITGGLTGTGLVYSDATGKLSGASPTTATTTLTGTITNSLSQTTNFSIPLVISAAGVGVPVPLPSLTGSPAVVAYYDFNDATKYTITSGKYTSVQDVNGGPATLIGTGSTAPARTTRDGKYVAEFTLADLTYLQASGLTLAPSGSIVVLWEPKTKATTQCLVDKANAASTSLLNRDQIIAVLGASNDGVRARKGGASVNVDSNGGGAGYNIERHLSASRANSSETTVAIYKNSNTAPVVNATGGTADGTTQDTITIGARQAAGARSLEADAYIAAVIIYATGITAQNYAELKAWANANHGTAF